MSRQTVLDTAQSQLGTTESPPNSNLTPYGAWYSPSLNGQKWCAMFVSWVFDHAKHPLGFIQTKHGIHHCQSAYNYYKAHGRLTAHPEPGDIVLYDWEGNGLADHIGIFKQWTSGAQLAFEAYEGNTSKGNNSDGGKVMIRVRSRNLVKAFVNPGVFPEQTVTPVSSELHLGSRGSQVTQLQKNLYALGYSLVIDGWFGSQTESLLKDYQTKNSMAVTGRANDVTLGALTEDAHQIAVAKAQFVSGSYLRFGNQGFMVTEVQRALHQQVPGLQLTINGQFDTPTLEAVKAFQKQQQLVVDGIVGPRTFERLKIVD